MNRNDRMRRHLSICRATIHGTQHNCRNVFLDSVWTTCTTITWKTNMDDTSWIIPRCCAGPGSRSLQCALAEGMGRSHQKVDKFHQVSFIEIMGWILEVQLYFRLTCGQVNQIGSITEAIEAGNGLREELMCTKVDVTCSFYMFLLRFQEFSRVKQSHFAILGCNHVSKCWMGRHGVSSFGWDRGPSVVMTLNIFCQLHCMMAMRSKDSFIADLVVGQILIIFFKLISCILVDICWICWYDLKVWINFASKGLRTGQIKTGAPCRSERLAKCLDVNEKGCEATAPVSQCEFSSGFFAVQVQSAPAYWGGTGFSCVFRWFLRKNYKFSNFRALYTSSNPSHAEAGTSFRNPKWLTDFSNRVRCTWYLPNWKYRNLNFFEQLVLSICFFLESITGSKLQYMNCKL